MAISAKNYFNSIGYGFKAFSNPADRAIALLSVEYPKSEETEKQIRIFSESYDEHLAKNVSEEAAKYKLKDWDDEDQSKRQGCCGQWRILYRRNRLNIKRNPMAFKARVG